MVHLILLDSLPNHLVVLVVAAEMDGSYVELVLVALVALVVNYIADYYVAVFGVFAAAVEDRMTGHLDAAVLYSLFGQIVCVAYFAAVVNDISDHLVLVAYVAAAVVDELSVHLVFVAHVAAVVDDISVHLVFVAHVAAVVDDISVHLVLFAVAHVAAVVDDKYVHLVHVSTVVNDTYVHLVLVPVSAVIHVVVRYY